MLASAVVGKHFARFGFAAGLPVASPQTENAA
jgi:hypothetical protein